MRIICAGGGPGGLLAAVLLRAGGHDVTVLERQGRGAEPGWGVVFFDGLLEALESHDAPTAAAVREHAVHWAGQVIDIQGRAPIALPSGGHSIRRATLLGILGRRAEELGVTIRHDVSVGDPADLPEHDVLVAADGVRSALRSRHAQEFGTAIDERSNVYTWLGTTALFESFTFPFVRAASGWAWAHAYRFDARTSCFIVEMPQEVHDGLGLGALGTADALHTLEGLFARQLSGHSLQAPPGTGDVLGWTHFPRVTNERWRAGRTVLLGDAAHTTHFSIGSGTRLAMEDAMALAQALAPGATEDVDAALDGYWRRRCEELEPVQAEALNSARWFEQVAPVLHRSDHHVAMLFDRRRTPAQRRLPLPLYLALADAAEAVPALGAFAGRVAGKVAGKVVGGVA